MIEEASYADGTIRKYLEKAASDSPTPGGGSVSALAGALGVSMASMAAHFTVGRKKYAAVEDRVRAILGELESARRELLYLTDEDTRAYAGVSSAYGMKRGTREEKRARTGAIQEALEAAMAPPLNAVRAAGKVVAHLAVLVDIANPNLISDVGVAAILVEAALRSAKLNVEINLSYLKDEALVARTREEIRSITAQAREQADAVVRKVVERIGGET